MKKTVFLRRAAGWLAALAVFLLLSGQTFLSVNIEEENISLPDKIYVVGNPEFYPIEYYDRKSGSYQGVLPKLFERMSEETGLEFVYLDGAPLDQRRRKAGNLQAELISGCTGEELEKWELPLEKSPLILSMESKQGTTEIYIAFTSIASEQLKAEVSEYLRGVSSDDLTELLFECVKTDQYRVSSLWWLVAAGVIVFLFAGLCWIAILFYRYRKKKDQDDFVDILTGIGNRKYFEDRYAKELTGESRAAYVVAYIGFDIIRLNEYYGEAEAELQLAYAADVLEAGKEETDIVARVSGGCFAVAHVTGEETVTQIWIEKLLEQLNDYCKKYGEDYCPWFYAGIYRLTPSDGDCSLVLHHARMGFQRAMERDIPFLYSDPFFLKQAEENRKLVQHTLDGLRNREFRLFLQCIVEAKSGQITGAEALSRWDHPTKGLLRPGSYVELLEKEGQIAELDFYMFEEVCRQLEQWEQEGRKLSISCNFARTTICSTEFLSRVRKVAKNFHFDYSRLVIEITEDTMETDPEKAFANIRACKEMGFRIALDDLGSGNTSFSDLRDYPLDVIKIDRSILLSAVDEKGIALLGGIIELAHRLKLSVLCEGVETEKQYEMLKMLDCDYLQGYYFYHAVPCEEAERYLT